MGSPRVFIWFDVTLSAREMRVKFRFMLDGEREIDGPGVGDWCFL